MSKVMKWVGGVFLPVGLLFAGIGGWTFASDQKLAKTAIPAQGKVIELVRKRNSDGDVTYRPIVEFLDANGTRHEFTGQVGSSPPRHSTGETVQILYPPSEPGRAIIDGFMDRYFLPMMFGGLGTIFALVGGGILFAYFRRKKIIAALRQNGLPIQAKFLETYRDTSVAVNGRNPYRLLCEATHPATGEVQEFKSEAIWRNPFDKFKDGDKIRVLVDPVQPKNYFVDLTAQIEDYLKG
jgi:hypothetical protein